MKFRIILAGALLAAAPLCGASAQNWTGTYNESEGGHILGNPDADVLLTAFVSYSCPHCGTYEKESDALIQLGYVTPGKVAYQVRHVIRNEADAAAVLLTECGDEDKFWANHRAMMHAQEDWLAAAQNLTDAQIARWSTVGTPERMRMVASDLGFYDILERRGYSRAEMDRCLSDQSEYDRLRALSVSYRDEMGVPGTPSFAIGDSLLEGVHTWASLQPMIDAAQNAEAAAANP